MFKEISQYLNLINSYWTCRKSFISWVFLIAAIACSFIFVRLAVQQNELYGNIYNFVEQRDKAGVANILKLYTISLFAYLIVCALKNFLVSLAIFNWRKFLSENVVSLWLEKKKYHSVKHNVDNPDQRISEDVNNFCKNILNMLLVIFTEGLTFAAFIGVLWRFPDSLDFSLFGREISIGHYLAIGSFIYAVFVNCILFLIGKPLVSLDYEKERKEADYRYALMRVNHHSEEIAFQQGEEVEKEVINERFSRIKSNYYSLIKRTFSLNVFEYGYAVTLSILPVLASLPLYFADKISFGEVMRIGGAASSVLLALGVLISNFQTFAALQAAKNRLVRFLTELATTGEIHHRKISDKIQKNVAKIELSGIDVINSEDQLIVKDLKLSFELGRKYLLMGKSGIGKTSILRCLAKIWAPTTGEMHMPLEEDLYFVSQRPYLPLGTLARCLNYPYPSMFANDDLIVSEVLSKVGLTHLIDYLDIEKDYLKILSLGELQRLNFAKILLHKPKIIVMDEPTSSLDTNYEALMFELLGACLPKDTTIVTVSHSPEIAKYHDKMISIGEGENRENEPDLNNEVFNISILK